METYELRLVVRGLFLAVPGDEGDPLTVALVDARQQQDPPRLRADGEALEPHVCGLEFRFDDWVNRDVELGNLVPFRKVEEGTGSESEHRLYLYDRQRIEIDCVGGILEPDRDPERPVELLPSFEELVALDSIADGTGRVDPGVLESGRNCVALLEIAAGKVGSERRSKRFGRASEWSFVPARDALTDLPEDAPRREFNLDLLAVVRVPRDQPVRVRGTRLPDSEGEESDLRFLPSEGESLTLFVKNRELGSILDGTDIVDTREPHLLEVDFDFEWLYDLVESPGERQIPTTRRQGGASGGTGCGGGRGRK